MISINELREFSKSFGISQLSIVEKDWILSHLLNKIFESELFSGSLLFKGGTSLRKCWFENYRFSEDLDFTIVGNKLNTLEQIENEILVVKEKLYETGIKIETTEFRQTLNSPIGSAFVVKLSYRAILPVSAILPKISLDFTSFENVLLPSINKKIIHQYSDKNEITNIVNSYSLEEILAEKLRTMLQRFYPRDIYDIYFIPTIGKIDNSIMKNIFIEKCNHKKVHFAGWNNFFEKDKLNSARSAWNISLRHLVENLPESELVIERLKEKIPAVIIL
jgi:predicted nucleotidyltransferase component of viral defense system